MLALLSVAMNVVSAQTPQRFKRLSLEEGLPQSSVLALLQDHKGFLWFGTQDGLARYDGYSFLVFRKQLRSPHTLKGNWIQTLHEDKHGILWIGTLDGGLHSFDPVTQRFSVFPYKIHGDTLGAVVGVRSIYGDDASGNLVIGTNGYGMLIFDTKSKNYTEEYRVDKRNPKSLPGNGVRSFYADSRGSLWIATNNGLCKFDIRTKVLTPFHYTTHRNESETNNLLYICEDGRDTLLLGTNSGEVLRFSCTEENFLPFAARAIVQPYLAGFAVTSIQKDSQGTLWFATLGNGLVLLDKTGRLTHSRNISYDTETLSSNNLRTVFQDRSEMMWVGTNDGGVNIFDPKAQIFSLIRHNDALAGSLSANSISVLRVDHTGTIWIGTGDGLNAFNPATRAMTVYRYNLKNPFSISNNSILDIAEDSLGTVWVSTSGGGVNKFDRAKNHFTHLTYNEKQPEKSVFGQWVSPLYVDRRGALWMGEERPGFQCLNPATTTITHQHHRNALLRRPARVLLEDPLGSWWMGTLGDGLICFDSTTGQYHKYRNDTVRAESLADNTVNALLLDSRGWLWIGTSDGLDVFDRMTQTFRHIRKNTDGYAGVIYSLVEDGRGRIWFSDNRGLTTIAIADSTKTTPATFNYTVQRFDSGDGLQSNEFNQNSACRGTDGRLYFGGVNGVSLFHPDSIARNTQAPSAVITEFKLMNAGRRFDTSASEIASIQLSYKESSFTITFAALDFANPQKNLYAHKLENFDADWIYTDANERTARYTNLEGGTYVFRVKAANNHGVWNTEGARLLIVIAPPFWRTAWFYILLVVAFVGLVWSVAQRKLRTALRRAEELEKIREQESNAIRKKTANDFHDEFGHKLTRIAFLSEVMKQSTSAVGVESRPSEVHEQQLTSLNKIIDTATDLSVGLRDFLWALNPENDSLYQIGIRLKDFGEEVFEATDIAFHVLGVSEELEDIHFSMDERRHITLLFKEAMTLIARHGDCETVTFEILFEYGRTNIFLYDDGVQVGSDTSNDAPQNGSAHDYNLRRGLFSLHERAERAHGKLNIIFHQGQGTTIHFCKE